MAATTSANKKDRLQSYEKFWPYYLKEHSKNNTKYLHYLGSTLSIGALCGAAFTKNPKLLLAVPVAGIGSSCPRRLRK
jgi:hypothetical protein